MMTGKILADVGQLLLDRGLLLTALELHAELCERGEEVEVLREYFANMPVPEDEGREPASTTPRGSLGRGQTPVSAARSASQSSFDDDSFSRFSMSESQDQAREREEHVAVLEYELRKANDTIEKLRARLTSVAAEEQFSPTTQSSSLSSVPLSSSSANATVGEHNHLDRKQTTVAAKSFEKRTINYLINEFLRDTGRKMAAITFANENDDQDLEDWKDVGIDLPPPAPIVELLRSYSRKDEARRASTPAAAYAPDSVVVQELHSTKEQNASLRARIMALEKALREQGDQPAKAASSAVSASISSEGNSDTGAATRTLAGDQTKWLPVQADLIAVTSATGNPRLELELAKLTHNDESTVMILGSCLPNVIPNVLLNKRDELIPILLSVIKHHPDNSVRDVLTNQLFTLAKKPDDAFRNIIITGCIALARTINPDRLETELLPQLWEQVSNKHPERRALVAESCGTLAAYVKPELRSSLIFSIIQQLYNDKIDFVREAVVRNLALLLTHMDDQSTSKIAQVREMVVQFVRDEHPKVVDVTHKWLLPVFAKWTRDNDEFMSQVLMWYTKDTLKQLEKYESLTVLDKANLINEKELKLLEGNLSVLKLLIRQAAAEVFVSAPFAAKILHDNKKIETTVADVLFPSAAQAKLLQAKFDDHVNAGEHSTTSWSAYNILVDEFLPNLFAIVGSIDAINSSLFKQLNEILLDITAYFGTTFTRLVVKPLFASHIDAPEQASFEAEVELDRSRIVCLRRRLMPCYLASIYTPIGTSTLVSYVRHVVIEIAQKQHYWSTKDNDVVLFSLQQALSDAAPINALCDLFEHDLVPHPSAQVRAGLMPLFSLLVSMTKSPSVSKRLLSCLVTAATDSDLTVKNSTIAGFGAIIENVSDVELLEKILPPLLAFGEDPTPQVRMDLLKMYILATPKADPAFRDEFIINAVLTFVDENKNVENKQTRAELASAFVEAFKVISCCYLSETVIHELLQPGLRLTIKELEALGGDHASASSALYEIFQQSEVKLFAAGVKKGDTAPALPKKDRVFKTLERRYPNWVEQTTGIVPSQPTVPRKSTQAAAATATNPAAAGSTASSFVTAASSLTSGWKNLHNKLDLKL